MSCDFIPTIVNINGEQAQSQLYADLLSYYKDRNKATKAYEYAHSDEFLSRFGDWLTEKQERTDENGEPYYEDVVVNQFSPSEEAKSYDVQLRNAKDRVQAIKQKQINLLRDNIDRLEKRIESGVSQEIEKGYRDIIEKNNDRIRELKESINQVEDVQTVDFVITNAYDDLQFLSRLSDAGIPSERITFAMDVVNFWLSVTTPEVNSNTVFTREQMEDDYRDELRHLHSQFSEISNKVNERINEEVQKFASKYNARGGAMTEDELMQAIDDEGWLKQQFIGISHIDHPVVNAIYRSVKLSNTKARQEAHLRYEDIDNLVTRHVRNNFPKFFERREDGSFTGRYTSRYTAEYWDKVNEARKKGEWFQFAKENLHLIDLNKLVSDYDEEIPAEFLNDTASEQEKQNYREWLQKVLGPDYNQVIEEVQKQAEEYQTLRRNKYYELLDDYDGEDISNRMKEWQNTNDPFQYKQQFESHEKVTPYFRQWSMVHFIPTNSEFYNNDYMDVRRDNELSAFYDQMRKVMKEMDLVMPRSGDRGFHALPFVRQSTMENIWGGEGGLLSVSGIWENIRTSMMDTDESSELGTNVDLATGEELKKINANFNQSIQQQIEKRYEELIQINRDPVEGLTDEQKKQYYKQAQNETIREQSFDLQKMLKVYTMSALMYKHKAVIEDQVRMARNFVRQRPVKNKTLGGKVKKSLGVEVPKEDNTSRFMEEVDYFINTVFYEEPRANKGWVVKDKVLTDEEKEKQAEIDRNLEQLEAYYQNEQIKKKDYKKRKKELEEMKEELGSPATMSKIFDKIFKFFQYKIMGWNLPAATANIGFGYVGNYVEAGDHRFFTEQEMSRAYRIMFSKYFHKQNSQKIEALMKRIDVLKKSSEELFRQAENTWIKDKAKWAHPFMMQDRTEFFNQAPIMIAMMLNTKVDTNTAKVDKENGVALWNIYNENGKIKDEYRNDKMVEQWENFAEGENTELDNFKLKVDQKVARVHGNYDHDNPILAKKTMLGKAFSQFRTWMFEGFNQRFEEENYDPTLDAYFKGRYRTGVLPFTGRLRNDQGDIAMNSLQSTLFQFKQFALRSLLMKNKAEKAYADLANDGIKEVDIINLRRNLNEMLMYTRLYLLQAVLSAALGEDDDEENRYTQTLTYLYNQGMRVQSDILLYLDPRTMKQIAGDPAALFNLYDDFTKFAGDLVRTHAGDTEPELQSGPFEGESRNWRNFRALVPLWAQVDRMQSIAFKKFDEY